MNERQDDPLGIQDYFGSMALVAMDNTLRGNASALLTRVNRLLCTFGHYRRVVRGFAPAIDEVQSPEMLEKMYGYNALIPSKHQTAEAVDLADPDGDLDQWLMDNQKLLEACGLWLEHPASTRGHCHLQSVPPKGGAKGRLFYP